jgi:hypothetical protein
MMADRCRILYSPKSTRLPAGRYIAAIAPDEWDGYGGFRVVNIDNIPSPESFINDIGLSDYTWLADRATGRTRIETKKGWAQLKNGQLAGGKSTDGRILIDLGDRYANDFICNDGASDKQIPKINCFNHNYDDGAWIASWHENPPHPFVSSGRFDARGTGSYGWHWSTTNGDSVFMTVSSSYTTQGAKPLVLRSYNKSFWESITAAANLTSNYAWTNSLTGAFIAPNNSILYSAALAANVIPYSPDGGDTTSQVSVTNMRSIRDAIYIPELDRCAFWGYFGASYNFAFSLNFSAGGYDVLPSGRHTYTFNSWDYNTSGFYEPHFLVDKNGVGYIMAQREDEPAVRFYRIVNDTTPVSYLGNSGTNFSASQSDPKVYGPFQDGRYLLYWKGLLATSGLAYGHPETGWVSEAAVGGSYLWESTFYGFEQFTVVSKQ